MRQVFGVIMLLMLAIFALGSCGGGGGEGGTSGTVAAPTFTPSPGTYATAQSVTLSTTTVGASIRYTMDGSTPTWSTGTLYSGPILVSATTTIKAIAYEAGWTDSPVMSGVYTITGTVTTPTFSPSPGDYATAQNVTLSTTTVGASIRFTTDGSTPTSSAGTLYSSPIPVSAPMTIKAIAYQAGWTDSPIANGAYTVTPAAGTVAAPTFTPPPGSYATTQNVALSTTTIDASIRYTTDGSTPTSSTGTLYSGPILVSATTTIKAIAYHAGLTDSPVMSGAYTITLITVNAATGNDLTGDGAIIPYRTITKALSMASPGYTVAAAPGTYDSALGETFPIVIPSGVTLIGDEANKGNGAVQTLIRGGGTVARYSENITVAVLPGDDTTISGFTIRNDTLVDHPLAIAMHFNRAAVKNNRIVDHPSRAIYVDFVDGGAAESGRVISGNVVQNNYVGICFVRGTGGGTRVENNIIGQNNYGVEYDTPGTSGDLGGGAAGSVGGNVIAGNTSYDLWTDFGSASTIFAANNSWDHAPPDATDIYNPNGATIDTTGASLAP